MASLELSLRYYWMIETPLDVLGDERNFREFFKQCQVPAEQSAVVVIDAWDFHYMHSHWLRTKEVADTRISPVLAAARDTGITVIHAPGEPVARKYQQWMPDAYDAHVNGGGEDEPGAWPPRAFRRREGDYAAYLRHDTPAMKVARERARRTRGIIASVAPQQGDFVVATGDQMHRLCRDRRILHLFYCGFSAAGCVLYRDVGIHPFSKRGYHTVLLRDCTVAVEHHDTVADETLKRIAIRVLEMSEWAPTMTTTSDAFIQACRGVSSREAVAAREAVVIAS